MLENTAGILTIDLQAIVANWRLLSTRVAPAHCGAVVKADAYGLGAAPVVRALLRAGCREFFVALVSEGIYLRQALHNEWPDNARVHVLNGALPGAETSCLHYDLTPVLNSMDQVKRWQNLAQQEGKPLAAAIQIDTGMARLGLSLTELQHLCTKAGSLEGIAPTMLISHLVSAEDPAAPINALQLQRFRAAHLLMPVIPACLSNSSGIFLGTDFHFNYLRPGAALYGVQPTINQLNPMLPVIRLRVPLIQWRELDKGDAVGYNHTWHAAQTTRIGTVSLGYADGYLRSASNRACLRLDGVALRVVGRVSMDTITIDLSAISSDRLVPGMLLDAIDETQDINVLAQQAGTNAYEILTSLGHRYHRHYVE